MCLHHVTEAPKRPWKYGYKVFRAAPDGTLRSPYQGVSREVPVGERVNEQNHRYPDGRTTIRTEAGADYPIGWHSFKFRKDAKAWTSRCATQIIRKVMVEEPLAYGEQVMGFSFDLVPVVVSRYITVQEV